MKMRIIEFWTLMLLVCSGSIQASVIYSYTGNNYLDTYGAFNDQMSISGFLELDGYLAPSLAGVSLDPLAFSFENGVQTLDQANATSTTFVISTDALGNITEWNIHLRAASNEPIGLDDVINALQTTHYNDEGYILTCTAVGDGGCVSGPTTDWGVTLPLNPDPNFEYMPGTWSVTAVPLPASVWLLASGLVGLLGFVRRRAAV